jgi:CBS domain-containing protein
MKTLGSLISDTVFYTDQSEMQYFQTLSYNNTPLRTCYHYGSEVAQLMADAS